MLKGVIGHDSFRFGQLEAITAVMEGNDVVVRLTTSAGKSLCYQMPLQLRSGSISLIISLVKECSNERIGKPKIISNALQVNLFLRSVNSLIWG